MRDKKHRRWLRLESAEAYQYRSRDGGAVKLKFHDGKQYIFGFIHFGTEGMVTAWTQCIGREFLCSFQLHQKDTMTWLEARPVMP